ncbi:hypothetical protein SAMN05444392_11143 [Seinonella peptonophila]|uniref:Uncharacterized protein n=1 Tax=Seinonella peptonophila TaxID=112248 RepID=A0A1M4ZZ60_9BACL|nr:hypothetical protein [Seinonella peptonophila]SHF22946.1 hypothetical protein SAMN05444392_11143 [Seinonella peptonophila]
MKRTREYLQEKSIHRKYMTSNQEKAPLSISVNWTEIIRVAAQAYRKNSLMSRKEQDKNNGYEIESEIKKIPIKKGVREELEREAVTAHSFDRRVLPPPLYKKTFPPYHTPIQ